MKRAASALLVLGLATPLQAVTVPSGSALQDKAFRDPGLAIPPLEKPLGELAPGLAATLGQQLPLLRVPPDAGFYDWRAGRWGSLIPSEPLIPGDGVGNDLASSGGGGELRSRVWDALSAYLGRHRDELRVDPAELGVPRVGVFEDGNLIQVHVPRVVAGLPVRDSGLTAIINHGNLVLLGLQQWGDVDKVDPAATSLGAARAAVERHLEPFRVESYREDGRLELIPTARGEDLATTPVGAGYAYRLAWVLTPSVEGDMGSWEALVDARTGELLSFQDLNQYAVRRAVGGVFPVSNDGRPPDGIEQAGWPMPFANITSGSPTVFTTTGGVVPACINGPIATTLNGQFVRITDSCGAINETSAGDIDLGTSSGTDCTVPAGHSAGDTHSARTGFYELNRIKEQAKGYLPGNVWLSSQLTSNMNINNTCNAFWNGATVNFYRDNGSTCRNTGEIAAVFDHEWGHGLDNNGANPNIASPGEAIADIRSTLRLNNSCVGRGFRKASVCGGYGDPCVGTAATGCTGVRDADFALHVSGQPHGISWILGNCAASGQRGPCNRETHCEGQIVSEVGWDLQFRDLRAAPFNFDSNTALELATRAFYLGAETVTSWYTCAAGCETAGTCGCGATGGYLLMLAADDDNGNLNDGTPHMQAVRNAFNRHQVACTTPAVANSGCAGGPTNAPTVTATPAAGGVDLSWTAVAGATHYFVYRTEGVSACSFGKVKVADVAGTTFSDTGLLDGRSYSYVVLPVGSNNACFGRMSSCASATPTLPDEPCVTVTVQFSTTASTVAEAAGTAPVVVTLATSNGQPTTGPVMVNFVSADGTATAGADYAATSGTLTFPTGTLNGGTQTINVPVLDDALDEADETFTETLSNPAGASLGSNTVHTVTITDDDAAPSLSIGDASVREGTNGTTTPASFTVSLNAPSGQTVTVGFATSDGTASAGTDYVAAAGALTFSPGATTSTVTVTVNGDDLREADETLFVDLTGPTNAGVADGQALGTIVNDDSWAELSHGQALGADLQAQPGPTSDLDVYRLSQKPGSSYEVLLDATSGDLGVSGPTLELVASDGTTVLQGSQPAGSGSSRSLRFENASAVAVEDQTLRVTAPSCSTACGPEAVYRIRLYDTTASIPRFNNSATQVTVLVLQNMSSDTVTGTIRFWGPAGNLLASRPFSLSAHGALVLNTAGLAGVGGQSGTITIASDAAWGSLAGKAVAVEPATGFTFDTRLGYRPR